MAWTQKLVDELKAHRDAGLSRREIAATMKMSLGQITGMFDRLNQNCGVWRPPLSPTERKAAAQKGGKSARSRDPSKCRVGTTPKPRPPKVTRAPDPIVNNGPTILTVGTFHCKWPVGIDDEALWRFCGDVTHGVRPYCRSHLKIAYLPKQARKA